MNQKEHLREIVKQNLPRAINELNNLLSGKNLNQIEPILNRIGRGGKIPHWFGQLKTYHSLPNLDGKTIGSIIEMLLVSVLEYHILGENNIELTINPAKGVDIPDLNLGIKSPSENYCTSEPFFSAYERILGNEYDAVVLLTNYQSVKSTPPLKVSIIKYQYLKGSEIADKNLCIIGKKHRIWLLNENESWAKKYFRFLSFVNQSDWTARKLLTILNDLDNDNKILSCLEIAKKDFIKQNNKRNKDGKVGIPQSELDNLLQIEKIKPLHLGVITAIDDWVAREQKDFGRLPNENEWERIKNSPLDGKIGMSFALQWRYNFGSLFSE
jgi:hypothetical protein